MKFDVRNAKKLSETKGCRADTVTIAKKDPLPTQSNYGAIARAHAWINFRQRVAYFFYFLLSENAIQAVQSSQTSGFYSSANTTVRNSLRILPLWENLEEF